MRNKKKHITLREFLAAWYSSNEPVKADDPKQLKIGFIDDGGTQHLISLSVVRQDAEFCFSEQIKMFFGLSQL